jgi:hypothetical protein
VARAAGPHGGEQCEGQPQRGEIVERHRSLEVVQSGVGIVDRPADRPTGVVDEGIDATVSIEDLRSQMLDGFVVSQVARICLRGSAVLANTFRELVQNLGGASDE